MLLLPPPLRLLDLEWGILCNQIWKMLPFLYWNLCNSGLFKTSNTSGIDGSFYINSGNTGSSNWIYSSSGVEWESFKYLSDWTLNKVKCFRGNRENSQTAVPLSRLSLMSCKSFQFSRYCRVVLTMAKLYWAQKRKQKTDLGIFSIKPLALLVELHVPLVDVVDVIVWVVAAPPAI